MPSYHNNQLTMVGLDSDEDISYFPSTPAKRKRHDESTMSGLQNLAAPAGAYDGSLSQDPMYLGGDQSLAPQQYDNSFDFWSTPSFPDAYDPSYDWSLNNHRSMDNVGDDGAASSSLQAYGDLNAHAMLDTAAQDEHVDQATAGETTVIKAEESEPKEVSHAPYTLHDCGESDESDYAERRPSKVPKLNKDGIPRKPRQPRAKLLKWDDNDWKNVALGIVWACGDNGIQIPFGQASQLVSESCTASALQQALLKLRAKQISEGHQIPPLRMAWTRKNRNSTSSSSADTNTQQAQGTNKLMPPKKKPTHAASNQTRMVNLKRAYKDADRYHLVAPHVPAATFGQAGLVNAGGAHSNSTTTTYPGNYTTSGQSVPMSAQVGMTSPSMHSPVYALGWEHDKYAAMPRVGPAEYQNKQDTLYREFTIVDGESVVMSSPRVAGSDARRHRRSTTMAPFDPGFMFQVPVNNTAEEPRTPPTQNTLAATLAAARTPGRVAWSIPAAHQERSSDLPSPLSPTPRRDWPQHQLLGRRRGPMALALGQANRNEWDFNVNGSLQAQVDDVKGDEDVFQDNVFSEYNTTSYGGHEGTRDIGNTNI
jgi:hypothetical protein